MRVNVGKRKKPISKEIGFWQKTVILMEFVQGGRCAVLTRYSPLKNCDIMEVLYSNIPSAMRRFSSHSAVLLLSY